MPDIKAIVTARAQACGFNLVGVTGADDFAADRDAALERIRDERMGGRICRPGRTGLRLMRWSACRRI